MTMKRIGVVTAFALATAFAPWQMVPALASTCSYNLTDHVTVALSGNPSDTLDVGPAGEIQLNGSQCDTATVSNTDTIGVTGGSGANALTIVDPAAFAPGIAAETGTPEIEISVTLNGGPDSLTVQGTANADTFVVGAAGINVNGDDDGDDIAFSSAALTLAGLGGNDTLTGDTENDTLIGGIGDDTYTGGGGIDTADLSGAASALNVDLLAGTGSGEGADTFATVENVIGSPGNDSLAGDGQANVLQGAGGDDTLAGLGGNDNLQGGPGTDTAAFSSAVNASLLAGSATGEGTDTLSGVENLTGSPAADDLTGDGTPNVIRGGAGNDSISGGLGDDALDGEGDDDVLRGGGGDDSMAGGLGVNTADYAASAAAVSIDLGGSAPQATGEGLDTLANIQHVVGSAQNDSLLGSSGADALDGGAGNDAVDGQQGADSLTGGPGNDTMQAGVGNDLIDGGADVDTIDLSAATGGVTAGLPSGTSTGSGVGTDTLSGFESIVGSKQGDVFTGSAAPNRIDARGGNDTLSGAAGADTLLGGPGNDRYDGGPGIDSVSYAAARKPVVLSLLSGTATGEGSDILKGVESVTGSPQGDALRGGNGGDVLSGAGGNDRLTGLLGNDVLTGGLGKDTVNYGSASGVNVNLVKGTAVGEGNDTLAGIENIEGDSARDIVVGNRAANVLTGNNGNDVLRGGGGNDKLSGVSGNDNLAGGPGRDTLIGGDDNDALNGGPGSDTCYQNQGRGPVKACEHAHRRTGRASAADRFRFRLI